MPQDLIFLLTVQVFEAFDIEDNFQPEIKNFSDQIYSRDQL
jgi:hypothetical protein